MLQQISGIMACRATDIADSSKELLWLEVTWRPHHSITVWQTKPPRRRLALKLVNFDEAARVRRSNAFATQSTDLLLSESEWLFVALFFSSHWTTMAGLLLIKASFGQSSSIAHLYGLVLQPATLSVWTRFKSVFCPSLVRQPSSIVSLFDEPSVPCALCTSCWAALA